MKLVEILAQELNEWPEGVKTYAQDADGTIGASDGAQVRSLSGKGWSSGKNEWVTEAPLNGEKRKTASDHSTAIITRADWEAERARIKGDSQVKPKANKDGWIRHRGGKRPVDGDTKVDVKWRDGTVHEGLPAHWFLWHHTKDDDDIMAWNPHKAEPAIVCDASVLTDGLLEPEMPAAKQDGPLKWRDRILELDAEQKAADEAHKAATEARDAERASLVAKLKAEGLALVQAEEVPSEDMSDWRNWRIGDRIEVTETDSQDSGHIKGAILDIDKIEKPSFEGELPVKTKQEGEYGNWPNINNIRWHSRPSK